MSSNQFLREAFVRWALAGLPATISVGAAYPDEPDDWPWRLLCGAMLQFDARLPGIVTEMLSLPPSTTYSAAALGLLRKGADPGSGRWQSVVYRDGPLHSTVWRDMHDPPPEVGDWQFFDGPLPAVGMERRRVARPA
jgi:hypothetical protein